MFKPFGVGVGVIVGVIVGVDVGVGIGVLVGVESEVELGGGGGVGVVEEFEEEFDETEDVGVGIGVAVETILALGIVVGRGVRVGVSVGVALIASDFVPNTCAVSSLSSGFSFVPRAAYPMGAMTNSAKTTTKKTSLFCLISDFIFFNKIDNLFINYSRKQRGGALK